MSTNRIVSTRVVRSVTGFALVVAMAFVAAVMRMTAHGDPDALSPFLAFPAGVQAFTQDLWGVASDVHFNNADGTILGGVAFDPSPAEQDPIVVECTSPAGSPLWRFNRQGVGDLNSSELHPETRFPGTGAGAAGCGLVNHPDTPNGAVFLYSAIDNGTNGLVRLTLSGAAIGNAGHAAAPGPRFGPRSNTLSIAVHPVNQHIYYGSNGCTSTDPAPCEIYEFCLNAGLMNTFTAGNPSAPATFTDGLYFDPTGQFLFISQRDPQFALTVMTSGGAFVQDVPMNVEPDGVAFHVDPPFVVTNNTNIPTGFGNMTRFDFCNVPPCTSATNDFTAPPFQSTFADLGSRGDLLQVGGDGCIYLTQAETRYDNQVTTDEGSLVQICGGFAPPPGTQGTPPPQDPVVVFTMTTSATTTPGSLLHYKLDYANIGPAPSQSAQIVDYLPAQVTFVSASNGGVFNAGTRTVTWNLGTVPISRGSRDLVVRVRTTTGAGTVITNRAEFTGLLTVAPPAAAATVVAPRN